MRQRNLERIDPVAGTIWLPGGYVCFVDPEDVPLVSEFSWVAKTQRGRQYAHSTRRRGKPRLFLHVLLMGTREGFRIDHIDNDGLNNRRSNLRWATGTQNQANKKRQHNGRSRYKGVWFPTKAHPHWRAAVMCNGVRYFLGVFDTEEAAARAYDAKAKELFGEFARVNFPEEPRGD